VVPVGAVDGFAEGDAGLASGAVGSVVGSSLGSTDGAGVRSGLPWATDGSGDVGTTGTDPSGPLPALQAATRPATARSAERSFGRLLMIIGSISGTGSSASSLVRRDRSLIAVG
jgi:hypothetical protein